MLQTENLPSLGAAKRCHPMRGLMPPSSEHIDMIMIITHFNKMSLQFNCPLLLKTKTLLAREEASKDNK